MSAPPKIFISAVSKELRSQRDLVAKTLRLLGCDPIIQNEFGTEPGNIREMLEEKLKPCCALIQLVGHARGFAVKGAQRISDVMSYTQYEADYAERENKTVWYILIAESWTPLLLDAEGKPVPAEGAPESRAQQHYRYCVGESPNLYHTVADEKELEICILKMIHPLDKLRGQRTHWITPQSEAMDAEVKPPASPADLEATVRKVFDEYIQRLPGVRQQSSGQDEAAREEELIAELAKHRGLDPKQLRRKLAQRAEKVQKDKSEPNFKRAEAAYAKKDYVEAERLALKAAEEAKKANPRDNTKVLNALELAGQSASERRDDVPALRYLQEAAALTDQARDPLEWARVHHALADTLDDRGEYAQAEKLLHKLISIRSEKLGSEHSDTLNSRNNLAIVLYSQGEYAKAEAEFRAVLKIQQRILGLEHLNTLSSRGNLANALGSQGKYAEAEAVYRAMSKIWERVLGPEHPDTLICWNNLALALDLQGKHAEAEAEHRAVLKIWERALGSEYPNTLECLYDLALCLREQGKAKDALPFSKRAVEGAHKVLGISHPKTKIYERLLKHLTDSK
jgi:tetratricopeptide (TPR) repeat protein